MPARPLPLLLAWASLGAALAPSAFAVEAFQESGGQVVMEAEHYDHRIPRSEKDWVWETSKPGFSGQAYLRALPNTGVNQDLGYVTSSPELVFPVLVTNPGMYFVWIRGYAVTTGENSAHVGLDGVGPSSAHSLTFTTGAWTWSRSNTRGPATLDIPAPGLHTVHFWMREDGFRVDKLLLRKDSSFIGPSGAGPAESPQVSVGSDSAAASLRILRPAQDAMLPAGVVEVEFAVDDFVLGDQGEPHLHYYIDGETIPNHFFNGTTQEVLREGQHTHATHWESPTSIELLGLAQGPHTVRFVLAEGNEQELTDPGATQTLQFTLSPPPASEFSLVPVVSGLIFPVAMAFAPDGRLFYNELVTGAIRIIHPGWQLDPDPFYQLNVRVGEEQGLLGLALDPDFAANHYVYVYHTAPTNPVTNRVVRLTDVNGQGANATILLNNLPAGGVHNGGNLHFGPDGELYVTIGETGDADGAQDLDFLGGKILRFNADGTVPADNPFAGSPVWALGLRNSFDFTFHPHTGALWATENGPDVNDEVNRIVRGGNYGWPHVTGQAGDPRFLDPLASFTPPIAPTGIVAVGDDSAYPEEYEDNLLMADFNEGKLRRFVLAGAAFDALGSLSTIFNGGQGFLLDLVQGPDGFIYVSGAEAIYRLVLTVGLTDVQVADVTSTTATITWTTATASSSQVEYGPDAGYGQASPLDPTLVTAHQVTLTGLTPGTLYHFRARSTDAGNVTVTSVDRTFSTVTMAAAFQESAGQVVMEAEHYDGRIPRSGKDWVLNSSLAGYGGEGYLRALPNTGTNQNTGYTAASPELIYNVHVTTPGTYYVWVRGAGATRSDDSLHAGLDGNGPPSADRIGEFAPTWTWNRDTFDDLPASLVIATPGLHTVHLWMREDGLQVDRLLLRLDNSSAAPSGLGPPESPRGSGSP